MCTYSQCAVLTRLLSSLQFYKSTQRRIRNFIRDSTRSKSGFGSKPQVATKYLVPSCHVPRCPSTVSDLVNTSYCACCLTTRTAHVATYVVQSTDEVKQTQSSPGARVRVATILVIRQHPGVVFFSTLCPGRCFLFPPIVRGVVFFFHRLSQGVVFFLHPLSQALFSFSTHCRSVVVLFLFPLSGVLCFHFRVVFFPIVGSKFVFPMGCFVFFPLSGTRSLRPPLSPLWGCFLLLLAPPSVGVFPTSSSPVAGFFFFHRRGVAFPSLHYGCVPFPSFHCGGVPCPSPIVGEFPFSLHCRGVPFCPLLPKGKYRKLASMASDEGQEHKREVIEEAQKKKGMDSSPCDADGILPLLELGVGAEGTNLGRSCCCRRWCSEGRLWFACCIRRVGFVSITKWQPQEFWTFLPHYLAAWDKQATQHSLPPKSRWRTLRHRSNFRQMIVLTYGYVYHGTNGQEVGRIYEEPVLPVERTSNGHLLAGVLWERTLENVVLKNGWEKAPTWECPFFC